jgi:hypothetical protein
MPGEVSRDYTPPDTPEWRDAEAAMDEWIDPETNWPTIEDMKKVAKRHNLDGVILLGFAFTRKKGIRLVTYGRDRKLCKAMGSVGDQLAQKISSGEVEPK